MAKKDTSEKVKEAAEAMAEDAKAAAGEATNFVASVVDDVTEVLDSAVDTVGNAISSGKGNKIAGGAAVGALAAVVLPFSLVGGALLGAGYAVLRGRTKDK